MKPQKNTIVVLTFHSYGLFVYWDMLFLHSPDCPGLELAVQIRLDLNTEIRLALQLSACA